ncbi:uncharacterized protein LOC141696157 [Apium graveolens]|uniref:uncharacterized protein LOC141696157 n=1 Tax=Apium graveolens TaxID=4045 RepID=UPI003D7B256B
MTLDQRDDNTSEDADSWMKTYKEYLQFGTMPTNNNEARIHRMKASRQTTYSLVYGTEAVLPTEVMIPTARYGLLTSDVKNIELSHDKDTVDELREMTKIRLASYQQRVANTYNKHVHIRNFRVSDMVLRKTFQNTMDVMTGKFADTW